MNALREQHRTGLDCLAEVTSLLRRIRTAHPTSGLYEAADLQWWWSQRPRRTDTLPQLFWIDHLGRPEAAIIATESGGATQLDPILMPDAGPDLVARVIERGLAHAADHGIDDITLEVDQADEVLREVLITRGFAVEDDGVVEAWLAADARPAVSELQPGYRLTDRLETAGRPHHMTSVERNHPDPDQRLRQTSLYRPELDLVVFDRSDDVAAYGLFWYEPESRTALVEPMRTEDAHQRRGLARHVLTAGIDRLVRAGAERIKICFEPSNPASKHLYLSVGFEPDRQTQVFARRSHASTDPASPSDEPVRVDTTVDNG